MNARQKAKKLKKELDYIKNQPVRKFYKVINIEADHLRAYRVFYLEEIEKYGEEAIEDEARLQLSRDLMKIINEKIVVNKSRDLDRFHGIKYSTDIWISFGKGNVE